MSAGARPPLTGATFGGKPDDFQVHTIKPDVRFLIRGVQPPSSVYVTTDDDLVIACATSQTGEAVTVSYRLLRADGQIVLGQGVIRPASDRSLKVHSESLCEGFLLSVSCKAAVATTRGQTFARIFLSNPSLGGGQPSYMLMSDYVTTAMAPAFPNGRQLAPTEGPGNIVTQAIANPGAGNDWFFAVFPNARWRLICFEAQFVASAAAGIRVPAFEVNVGARPAFRGGAAAGVAPGATLVYSGAAMPANATPATLVANMPIPPGIFLLPGGTFQVNTENLDVADNWFGVTLHAEEWLDNV